MKAQLIPVSQVDLKWNFLNHKYLDIKESSSLPKSIDSKAVLKAIKENLVSSTLRITGKFTISVLCRCGSSPSQTWQEYSELLNWACLSCHKLVPKYCNNFDIPSNYNNKTHGLVWWHINHCRLFNAKSGLYIYIRHIWFGWVLWHINHYRLFNARSGLYIYIRYIWFVNIKS